MYASPWQPRPGDRRRPSWAHGGIVVALVAIGIGVGTFGSLSVRLGFVSVFWPGQAVQAVGSIWYGGWGILAGGIFPFVSNWFGDQADFWQSCLFLPANLLQSGLPAWAFRHYQADPSLRSPRALAIWLLWGILIPNAAGAIWGTLALHWRGELTGPDTLPTLMGWFAGNSLPTLVLGSAILGLFSRSVTRTRRFCLGYWA